MIPLANHLVQSTVFAAIIGLLSRRSGAIARTRHALWMAASLKFLIPLSLLVFVGSRIPLGNAPAAPAPPIAPPDRPDWLARVAWALWMCGSAAILIRWRLRWKRIAAAVHSATAVPEVTAQALARAVATISGTHGLFAAPLAVSLNTSRAAVGNRRAECHSAPQEPGVFGIFRPVLLLPAGLEERLSAAELQAVLAHELCHIRPRDNFAAAIHMAIECIFWFHPLVWWIGARLVEERELACDEEVLGLGAEPGDLRRKLRLCQAPHRVDHDAERRSTP